MHPSQHCCNVCCACQNVHSKAASQLQHSTAQHSTFVTAGTVLAETSSSAMTVNYCTVEAFCKQDFVDMQSGVRVEL